MMSANRPLPCPHAAQNAIDLHRPPRSSPGPLRDTYEFKSSLEALWRHLFGRPIERRAKPSLFIGHSHIRDSAGIEHNGGALHQGSFIVFSRTEVTNSVVGLLVRVCRVINILCMRRGNRRKHNDSQQSRPDRIAPTAASRADGTNYFTYPTLRPRHSKQHIPARKHPQIFRRNFSANCIHSID